MSTHKDRESFEANYKKHYEAYDRDFTFDDGNYHNDAQLAFAWSQWQAACAYTRKEVIEECKQKLKSIPPMIVYNSDIDYCIAKLNGLLTQPTKG